MSKNYLGESISIIGLFVFMHYYVTIDFIHNHLSKFNLNSGGILSWDDVQFTLAKINTDFFVLLFFPLLAVAFCIRNAMKHKSNTFWGGICSIYRSIGESERICKWPMYIGVTLFFIIVLVCIVCVFILSKVPIHLIVIVSILGVIACIKYDMVYIFILVSIFYITTSIYRDSNQAHESLYSNDIIINLNSGETIKSDSVNNLIFFGAKYIIMQSDSSTVKLYPTSTIKDIEWINR